MASQSWVPPPNWAPPPGWVIPPGKWKPLDSRTAKCDSCIKKSLVTFHLTAYRAPWLIRSSKRGNPLSVTPCRQNICWRCDGLGRVHRHLIVCPTRPCTEHRTNHGTAYAFRTQQQRDAARPDNQEAEVSGREDDRDLPGLGEDEVPEDYEDREEESSMPEYASTSASSDSPALLQHAFKPVNQRSKVSSAAYVYPWSPSLNVKRFANAAIFQRIEA